MPTHYHGLVLPFDGRCVVCGTWLYPSDDIVDHAHRGHPRSVFDSKGGIKSKQDIAPPLPMSSGEVEVLEQLRAFAIQQGLKIHPCGCESCTKVSGQGKE